MTTFRLEESDLRCPKCALRSRLIVDRRGERPWLFCPDCPYWEPIDAWDNPLPKRWEIRELAEQLRLMSEDETDDLVARRKGMPQ